MPGLYQVTLRLKKGSDVVLAGKTSVTVRQGAEPY
jgi:hypothetical protein